MSLLFGYLVNVCSLRGYIHTFRQLLACNRSKREFASSSRASLNKEKKKNIFQVLEGENIVSVTTCITTRMSPAPARIPPTKSTVHSTDTVLQGPLFHVLLNKVTVPRRPRELDPS
jgi:hypothetical protein